MAEQSNSDKLKGHDIKVKTATAVMVMNIFLTCIKFLLYSFSGSMAILAEAWHSFSDIATSGLVLIAVRRSAIDSQKHDEKSSDDPAATSQNAPNRMEMLVSLGIGILLTIVAGLLLRKFIYAESLTIRNPLVSGILFLIFSTGSYFIYYFETRIGEKEGSIGLVTDGRHAKADMTASLLTGFSLIVYSMGLNLDRWVAGLIALFILSFALETFVNVATIFFRCQSEYLFKYRSLTIIASLFDRIAMQRAAEKAGSLFEAKFGKTEKRRIKAKALILSFLFLSIVYLFTAFFAVGVREKAIIERFGRPLNVDSPIGPGLHSKLPWPVDRVKKIKTTYIEELNIGNISDKQNRALIWSRKHGTEEPFLSGDNNFFYPYIVLHYRIKNVFQYLYENIDPRMLVNEVGHQVATALFVKETFYDIATTHRKRIEEEMLTLLQSSLDKLESGIELLSVNFKDIHPPISVADSFERVIAGYQEKQNIINDALSYKNNIVPESRGKAIKKLETARSYIIDREKRAEGKATRFNLSLPASGIEKEVAMYRIHLQTLKDVLKEKTKIVIDPTAGEPEIWMDFDSFGAIDLNGGD